MVEISNNAPATANAGDTIQWHRELPAYAASQGWSLGYTLVGSMASYAVQANAIGDAFDVIVSATTSAVWQPGTYRLVEYVTNGDRRYTLGSTSLRILPNLAAATAGIDTRSHARKVLDHLDAWLERKAPVSASWQIGDKQLQHYPLKDLLALRDRYAAMVAREEGRGGGRILTRL